MVVCSTDFPHSVNTTRNTVPGFWLIMSGNGWCALQVREASAAWALPPLSITLARAARVFWHRALHQAGCSTGLRWNFIGVNCQQHPMKRSESHIHRAEVGS